MKVLHLSGLLASNGENSCLSDQLVTFFVS
jgi:hypothetical protein